MTREIVAELVLRLAAKEDVQPSELGYRLSDYIDPEILEAIVSDGSEGCKLTFQVPGYEVSVDGLGEIAIGELTIGNRNRHASSRFSDFADLIFLVDEDGVYRDILLKPDGSELLYEPPDEIIDSSISEVLPPEAARRTERTITDCLRSGEEGSMGFELDVPAGTHYFDARVLPLEQSRGQRAVLIAVTDLSDERGAQDLHTNTIRR